jgi:hypothetical protein
MNPDAYLIAIQLFVMSIIFIVGAYLLQIISKIEKWDSEFPSTTIKVLIILSVLSLLTFVIIAIAIIKS